MDKTDPTRKIVELMKEAQPQSRRARKQKESSKIEIQGSGNIVLIGGMPSEVNQRLAELEQTLSLLLAHRQQTGT